MAHLSRLLLLHPISGAVDQMAPIILEQALVCIASKARRADGCPSCLPEIKHKVTSMVRPDHLCNSTMSAPEVPQRCYCIPPRKPVLEYSPA